MKKFRGMMYFLAGVVFTVVVMFSFFSTQDAEAGKSGCVRTDLKDYGSSGDIPDTSFFVTYTLPSCLLSQGYRVKNVWLRSNNIVAVGYIKND